MESTLSCSVTPSGLIIRSQQTFARHNFLGFVLPAEINPSFASRACPTGFSRESNHFRKSPHPPKRKTSGLIHLGSTSSLEDIDEFHSWLGIGGLLEKKRWVPLANGPNPILTSGLPIYFLTRLTDQNGHQSTLGFIHQQVGSPSSDPPVSLPAFFRRLRSSRSAARSPAGSRSKGG